MWRRAVALGRTPRSCATISSSLISEHAVSRASAARASESLARTRRDFTAGTEISSESAISAYDMPPNSRINSAERC